MSFGAKRGRLSQKAARRWPFTQTVVRRHAPNRSRNRARPEVQLLEDRWLLATYTVMSGADNPLDPKKGNGISTNGQITLHSAIQQVNDDGSGVINFNPGLMINDRALPAVTVTATIDGGAIGNVQISGSPLDFTAGGSVAEYLVINGSTGDGIDMSGTYNSINYDYIGTDLTGMNAAGNAGSGVYFDGPNNFVSNCVISANGGDGILIDGSAATNNTITGNMIGTNAAGTAALGNADWGVILDDAPSNIVGGTTAADRNLISGNHEGGIATYGGAATGDSVQGNYIGTNIMGTVALGNAFSGVYVGSGSLFSDDPPGSASNNTIGGTAPGAGNLISGNDTALTGNGGIVVYGSGASGNLIEGNQIGVNAAGTATLANLGIGVDIFGGATSNTVGGGTATAANVVSGNRGDGIDITGSGTATNLVQGNDIGVNAAGTAPFANTGSGIVISGANNNTIGGTTLAQGNVVSGNQGIGVFLYGTGTNNNLIEGNHVGTNVAGSAALGNGSVGVDVSDQAVGNTVGGTAAGASNLISGNHSSGVLISDDGTTGNLVVGNLIGTDGTGAMAIANTYQGVFIGGGATGNTVGGAAAGAGNVISGNNGDGLDIGNAGTSQNVVEGNLIGTDITGSIALSNTTTGLSISDSIRLTPLAEQPLRPPTSSPAIRAMASTFLGVPRPTPSRATTSA